jgi:alpha-1,2-mannosyltransferase
VIVERRVATFLGCVLLPLLMLLGATVGQALSHRPVGWPYALDFHPVWRAAHELLAGRSAYPPPHAVAGHYDAHIYTGFFVYPMPAAALFAPLGSLPYAAAAAVYTVVALSAVVGALLLLGVRDWRCYGAAFTTPAVTTAIGYGTLTPLFVLAIAVAWRFRSSAWTAGMAIGLAIALKLFLWPLLLWLVLARRLRAAGVAVATVAVAAVASWAPIGFADVRSFPTLMRDLATVQAPRGDGVSALVGPGLGLWLFAAAALAVVAVALRRTRDERVLLTAAVLLALAASPIVWIHYFALLLPLLALWSPRLSVAWFVPAVYWVTMGQHPGATWRPLLALTAAAVTVALAMRSTVEGRAEAVLSGMAFAGKRATMGQ